MKYLVEVPLNNAGTVTMEVDEAEDNGAGIVRSGRGGEVIATATKSFDAAMEAIQPMAQIMINKIRGLAESPDEIGIEFGLKMTIEAGLVIAHSGSEANFKVDLRWNRK